MNFTGLPDHGFCQLGAIKASRIRRGLCTGWEKVTYVDDNAGYLHGFRTVIVDPQDPRAQALLHLAADDVLQRVVDGLSKVGVRVLPVKGVVTAHQLYAEPWQRPIADIDVRIEPRHLGRVREAGRRAGWQELSWAPAYCNIVFDVSGIMVDVEGTIGPPGLCALSVEQMLSRAKSTARGHDVPELHDHALLLCVNAFKDKLVEAAPWSVEDLVRIVRQPGFDAGTFTERAREGRVVALVWIVADWLAKARGDAIWGAIRDRLSHRPPRALYRRLLARAVAKAPDGLAARVLTRIGADDPRMWARALGGAMAWQARVASRGRRG